MLSMSFVDCQTHQKEFLSHVVIVYFTMRIVLSINFFVVCGIFAFIVCFIALFKPIDTVVLCLLFIQGVSSV